jgi:hypothetical protein
MIWTPKKWNAYQELKWTLSRLGLGVDVNGMLLGG